MISAHQARAQWAACLDAVYKIDAVFGVTHYRTRRGELVPTRIDPTVVLISPELWQRGADRVPVPSSRRQQVSSLEGRAHLRKLRELAGRGMHTTISRYGEERAVIAPYVWAREALPEIIASAQSSSSFSE